MHLRAHAVFAFALLLSSIAGCGLTLDYDPPDPQSGIDAGEHDGGAIDAGHSEHDAGPETDAGDGDAGAADGGGADGGTVDLCAGRDEGDPCGEDTTGLPLVCLGGRCEISVCGDGITDERAGELCDDGNDVTADGCEPVSCVPSCSNDLDCDDENPCNGAEGCFASKCVQGTPPISPACVTPAGDEGTCDGGFCVPAECGNGIVDGGEECDDENGVAGDGCEPDCTRSCESNTECQDGDRCNGQELCTEREGCVSGEPIACLASDACHAAMCDPREGCRVLLVDQDRDGQAPAALGSCGKDCDDTDPARYDGATERCNGIDDDCDEVIDEDVGTVTCFPDADGDGFGDESRDVTACVCPAGSITRGGDCFDAPNPVGAAVSPAQTSFFRLPYCQDATSTDCSFDYDCDGSEERELEAVHTRCSVLTLLNRCTGAGWEGGVPACGVAGTWVECDGLLGPLGLLCTARRTSRVQTCR